MGRLIDTSKFMNKIAPIVPHDVFFKVNQIINEVPTVDAVPVVRCRDCERESYCECTQYQGENGYCSLGERKGD